MSRKLLSSMLIVMLALTVFFSPCLSFAQEHKLFTIAVLDLQANNIAGAEALALSDMLRSSIVNIINEKGDKLTDSYTLIERSQMDKIFDQFEVQSTGCVSDSCAVEFGKMLSVERIIIGSISLVGSTYIVVARIVDVESSKVLVSVDRNVPGPVDNVIKLMSAVGHELLTGERLSVPIAQTPAVPSQITPSQPTPTESFLSVSGNPENASVFLNDVKIGETPIDLWKAAPGRYTIKVSKTDYEDYEEEILISPGTNEKLSYKLTPYAVLSFIGTPDSATVTVDGENIGKTPIYNYTLPARQFWSAVNNRTQPIPYKIKVTHESYIGHEETLLLNPGSEHTVAFSLTALESISVSSQPAGAVVFVDGKKAGATPLENFMIPEGKHKVKIVSMGYIKYSTSVSVIIGEPVSVSWTLVPKTKQGAIKRSLAFPGSGQWYAGYTGKGAFITVLQLGTIGWAVASSMSLSKAIDEYDTAKQGYMNTKSSGSDFDNLYSDLKRKHDSASSAETLQMIAIGAVAVVYVYNVIDALITEPKIEVNPNFGMLRIEPEIGNDYAGVTMYVRF